MLGVELEGGNRQFGLVDRLGEDDARGAMIVDHVLGEGLHGCRRAALQR